MGLEKVIKHFEKYGIENRVVLLQKNTATVELAAKALGCSEAEIAKTISFYGEDSPILVVAAGDTKIDNKKFKECFKVKAKMIAPSEVETLVGHAVGGVCPFGINIGVKVYLDQSLKRFEFVYPACGSCSSVIKLTIEELEKYSGFVSWVDVCTKKESV